MSVLELSLLFAILLCSLVAGLVYTFAVVVMPGIQKLNDHDFLTAFKVMDGVIQNNDPKFVLVWLGSVLSILIFGTAAAFELQGVELTLALVATVLYLLGVQAPTVSINVPLNNELQALDLDQLSLEQLNQFRQRFEHTWLKWNSRRTIVSIVVLFILITLAIQL